MTTALAEAIEEHADTYPNIWERFINNAHKSIPFLFETPESTRWFSTQKSKREPYIRAGALRKEGKVWLWNPRRFVYTWERLNLEPTD